MEVKKTVPKLKNPLSGPTDPWSVTFRVANLLIAAVARLFTSAHESILKRVVRASTGIKDPRMLPEEPRRIVSRLCAGSAAFLLLSIGLFFAGRYEAIAAFFLSSLCSAAAGWWLRRTAGGIPRMLPGQGRLALVISRLIQVIRHGAP